MAKVLWIGDGGCQTGFARVTHAIGERLVEKYGHEVDCLATNYTGDEFETNLRLHVPTLHNNADVYGQGRFLELAGKIGPDVIIMLNDPQVILRWLLQNPADTDRLLAKHFPSISYIPIDGHNQPLLYESLRYATNRVAMSKFGQATMPGSELVYHGVDTDLFWPISTEKPIEVSSGETLRSKRDCKAWLGIPRDSFLVGRVDRNSGRKDIPATWKALVPVMQKHSDVFVWLHMKTRNVQAGINIPAMLSREPSVMDRFRFPNLEFDGNKGAPQQDLNAVYNAMDLFVSTSRGEGFGLTIAEAMACEVPVIAQNVSAIPEVVGPGGTLIDPEREITVPFGQDQWLANIGAFTEAIEYAYLHRRWRRETGQAGRKHVVDTFHWDDAAASFDTFITAFADERRARLERENVEKTAHGSRRGRGRRDPAQSDAGGRVARA